MGQVNGKLVAVGGIKKNSAQIADEVYTYDERSQRWRQTIPPMPTTRHSPGILSLQSALVVAGGNAPTYVTAAIEIFKPETSQRYRTDPLPLACYNTSLVAIGNTCYALGGYKQGFILNQALHASVDDLLNNAVPANQTTHSGNSDTQSAWKTLPNTPTYRPAAAVLAGNFLAIGGKEIFEWRSASKKEVYMYSSSAKSWIYISELPAPRGSITVAILTPTEVMVIGDLYGHVEMNTTYRGTLTMSV